MSLNVQIPGFEKQKIELKAGVFTNNLLINGQAAIKDPNKKTDYVATDDNGEERRLTLKGQGLDLPAVECNGETYHFAPPVSTGRKVFAGVLLIPLLFAGGALGGGLAGAGFFLAMNAYRSDKAPWLQHLICAGTAFGAWVLYFVVAVGLQIMINS